MRIFRLPRRTGSEVIDHIRKMTIAGMKVRAQRVWRRHQSFSLAKMFLTLWRFRWIALSGDIWVFLFDFDGMQVSQSRSAWACQVRWDDAVACATWAVLRLPSEAGGCGH